MGLELLPMMPTMRLLTVTQTRRWHAKNDLAGSGALYQGRFKSFPIQQDESLLSFRDVLDGLGGVVRMDQLDLAFHDGMRGVGG